MTYAARAQDLNDAERRVLEAIQSDTAADFTRDPGPKPQIAATFLEALISGTQAQWPALRGPLRIRGASIQGSLIPTSDRRPEGFPALLFRDCTFDAPVDLSGLDFLSLRFVDCALPAFIGDNLTTKADLDLSGSTISGIEDYECDLSEVGSCAIHLSNARRIGNSTGLFHGQFWYGFSASARPATLVLGVNGRVEQMAQPEWSPCRTRARESREVSDW